MNADVIALREHLVAEVERAKAIAMISQKIGADWRAHGGHGHLLTQRDGAAFDEQTRASVDAWLAADARLRALDGLIAASKAQHDAYELQSTGTFARGRWYTREEIDALMLAPCEGETCAWRECLPCGLRRLRVAVRP